MAILNDNQERGCKLEHRKSLEDEFNQGPTKEIVREYARLASQPSLPDEQQQRMGEIINLAKEDCILDFFIGEIDHFLDHELGLWDSDYDKNQQAKLQEFLSVSLNDNIDNDQDLSEELNNRISSICSHDICELKTPATVCILINFPSPYNYIIGSENQTHSNNYESEISMDITLCVHHQNILRLQSTTLEDATSLDTLMYNLPQPYGAIVEANRFVQDKSLRSNRNIAFLSSDRNDAMSFREAISSYICPFDDLPLIEHKFRIVSCPYIYELNSIQT